MKTDTIQIHTTLWLRKGKGRGKGYIRKVGLTDTHYYISGFPGVSDGEECLQCRRPGFDPRVRKIPSRREWQPIPVFLPGEFHEQRSLAGVRSERVGHD